MKWSKLAPSWTSSFNLTPSVFPPVFTLNRIHGETVRPRNRLHASPTMQQVNLLSRQWSKRVWSTTNHPRIDKKKSYSLLLSFPNIFPGIPPLNCHVSFCSYSSPSPWQFSKQLKNDSIDSIQPTCNSWGVMSSWSPSTYLVHSDESITNKIIPLSSCCEHRTARGIALWAIDNDNHFTTGLFRPFWKVSCAL